jgi:thiol-disulfide isomerase/thioredoxin|tara:strand:- start:1647 stop:2582 length:936 start_codon:yes stop_codon:yes gene_type:complete
MNKSAPEIIEINSENWINSKPLSLKELKGKVILLDFWAYSCINCLRTLPSLKEIWRKYKKENVVIIGIHTPEFMFEKDIKNVKVAVSKHKIDYPVANDPEGINWRRYGNKYWPRVALINPFGEIVMEHVGEAGYDTIEEKIIELIDLENKKQFIRINEEKRLYDSYTSRETYAGSLRNSGIGSSKVCFESSCDVYIDPGKHTQDIIYLDGSWDQKKEYLTFNGDKGYISFRFHAKEVNVVLSGVGIVEILLDNVSLTNNNSGKEVIFHNNKSYLKIDGPDVFNIVNMKRFETKDLKIIPFKNMEIYAYTFG